MLCSPDDIGTDALLHDGDLLDDVLEVSVHRHLLDGQHLDVNDTSVTQWNAHLNKYMDSPVCSLYALPCTQNRSFPLQAY